MPTLHESILTDPNPFTGGSFRSGNLTKKSGLEKAMQWQSFLLNRLGSDAFTGRGRATGTLFPQFETLAQRGFSPEDESSFLQSLVEPISGTFGSAREEAGRRVARTGNRAGYGSFLSEIGREEARQRSGAGREVQAEKFRRKQAGLEGLMKLYGIDTSFLDAVLGLQNQLFGIGSGIDASRFKWRDLGGILEGIGKAASGVAGAVGGGK